MLSEHIKIGDRVEISLRRDNAADKSYVSLVENKIGDSELAIDVPISHGQLVAMKPGDNYRMLFFTDKGMYAFDANILKYFKEDGFNLIKVRLTSKGEKVQRRDFYRYECYLPMKFTIIRDFNPDQNEGEKPPNSLHDASIRDVSGGGVKFETDTAVEEGNLIKCAFRLDGILISAKGKVLSRDTQDNGRYKYMYRVQFVKISLENQESIIKYIFMEQRKLLGRV